MAAVAAAVVLVVSLDLFGVAQADRKREVDVGRLSKPGRPDLGGGAPRASGGGW